MKSVFFALLIGLGLSAPAMAQTQLERIVGVPHGLLTTHELATVFMKSHKDNANERRTVIYRDRARRAELEPIMRRHLGRWSNIVVVYH